MWHNYIRQRRWEWRTRRVAVFKEIQLRRREMKKQRQNTREKKSSRLEEGVKLKMNVALN